MTTTDDTCPSWCVDAGNGKCGVDGHWGGDFSVIAVTYDTTAHEDEPAWLEISLIHYPATPDPWALLTVEHTEDQGGASYRLSIDEVRRLHEQLGELLAVVAVP